MNFLHQSFEYSLLLQLYDQKEIQEIHYQYKEKKQRKMHRHQSRKFMRSPHMSPISCSALPSTISISKQFMSPPQSNNSQASYEQIGEGQRKITFNTQYILQKLLSLERTVKQQKDQRSNEYNKIMKMVKEMSCRHTSIIYDTQIKYLKTCLSAQGMNDTFRSQISNQKGYQQKNVAHYSNNGNLQKNNVTMSKKPIRNSMIDRFNSVNEKQKNIKNPSINIISPKKIESNPEKLQISAVSSQKNEPPQQINIQKITGTIISKIEQKINQKISKNQQKQTQQLNLLINNKINQMKQQLKQNENLPKNQLNSLMSAQQQLQKNIESIRSNTNNVIQNLTKEVQNTQSKVKNNISLLASQFNEKIQQVTSNIAADSIKNKLESLARTMSELNDKLKSDSHAYESGLNMTEKKIINLENFMIQKLEQTKRQINRLQNIQRQRQTEKQSEKKQLKSLELEKQRMKQKMFRSLQQLIINQSENLQIEFSEKMESNYFKLEDQMLGIIERHVIYIQNFIKKIQAREDIIIKKYFTEAELQCPPELSNKSQQMAEIKTIIDQRSDELFRIMKEDFQFLNNKSIEIQSSLLGVLQRLNMQQGGVKIIN